MGARKRHSAESAKENRKKTYFAKLNDVPTSPRKMRLVANLIRGVEVNKALNILEHTQRESSTRLHKLLRSAIANWQAKNEGTRIEDSELFVKEIIVDGGRMLKRLHTAPQGRGYRIRKRSNHVSIIIDNKADVEYAEEEPLTEEPLTEEPLTEEPLTEEPLAEEPLAEETENNL
jgi:large subunit ribosomal protein L22